jgi:ABC-type Fe3+-hydroxamate transport system substrate-binding protein
MHHKIFQTITDQTGYTIELKSIPKRIISLVPSQTELLFDLNLDENIVGITKFCIHPKIKCSLIEKVGGTKKFNIEKIKLLQPDLIIANKEENYQEGIELLRSLFPVYTSDVTNLPSALKMISDIATICNKEKAGEDLNIKITEQFNTLNTHSFSNKISVAYLIWNNPTMAVGSNNFIDSMLQIAGFTNVFESKIDRYPVLEMQELLDKQPDVVMLSSEPFPFKPKHKLELESVLKNSKIEIVDGELFSWYGSRLLKTPSYLKKLKYKLGRVGVV